MAKDTNEFRVIGPPGCISGDAIVHIRLATNHRSQDFDVPLFELFGCYRLAKRAGLKVLIRSLLQDNRIGYMEVLAVFDRGEKECLMIQCCGRCVEATPDHEIFNDSGVRVRADSLSDAIKFDGGLGFAAIGRPLVCPVGVRHVYDITVAHPSGHGNFIAGGIVVSNCGKSTYLADQVVKRSQAWSIANEKPINQCTDVLLASLTKTAAAELRGRGLDLPAGQIGTLHSHALRALGSPKLCVGAKAISQWNKESPLEHWMSGGSTGDDELSVGLAQYNGDRLMSEYTTNRCRLTPREEWRGSVLEFAERYESWKRLSGMMDYEDLITNAYERQTDPPGNPSTILGDEQQDSSAADLRLMRYWGTKAQKLILVGDDDQRIFSFRGASEHGISGVEIPPDHEKVLEQSYRVPRAVHAAAMDVIRRIEHRKDVVYYPRDANGQVDRMHYSMRQNPYEVVDEIERLLKEPDEKPGTAKAMCLFSCAYQAQPLMYALKSAGIPFWNPYAVERSNFNPLHPSKGVSTLDRVLAYLKNSEACHGEHAATWTWEQFAAWAEMCSADGWLRHGAKTEIKKRASVAASLTMTVEEIEGLISNEDVMLDLAECDLGWLGQHILEPKRGVYDYVVDIVKKLGYTGITEQPRVIVGTGHSCKGGEAEHVFVCPDLSVSGWESYGNYDTRDSIYRLYYVMLTRARQRLILTAPSCPQAVML